MVVVVICVVWVYSQATLFAAVTFQDMATATAAACLAVRLTADRVGLGARLWGGVYAVEDEPGSLMSHAGVHAMMLCGAVRRILRDDLLDWRK